MKRKNYTTFAAIHLGSEMLSMQITEYHNTERYKVIECCNRRIRLGEATFKNKIFPAGFRNMRNSYRLQASDEGIRGRGICYAGNHCCA